MRARLAQLILGGSGLVDGDDGRVQHRTIAVILDKSGNAELFQLDWWQWAWERPAIRVSQGTPSGTPPANAPDFAEIDTLLDPNLAPLQCPALGPSGHGTNDVVVGWQTVAAGVRHRLLDERQAQPQVFRRRFCAAADRCRRRDVKFVGRSTGRQLDCRFLLLFAKLIDDVTVLIELAPRVSHRATAARERPPVEKD